MAFCLSSSCSRLLKQLLQLQLWQNSPLAKQSQYSLRHWDLVQLQGFLGLTPVASNGAAGPGAPPAEEEDGGDGLSAEAEALAGAGLSFFTWTALAESCAFSAVTGMALIPPCGRMTLCWVLPEEAEEVLEGGMAILSPLRAERGIAPPVGEAFEEEEPPEEDTTLTY